MALAHGWAIGSEPHRAYPIPDRKAGRNKSPYAVYLPEKRYETSHFTLYVYQGDCLAPVAVWYFACLAGRRLIIRLLQSLVGLLPRRATCSFAGWWVDCATITDALSDGKVCPHPSHTLRRHTVHIFIYTYTNRSASSYCPNRRIGPFGCKDIILNFSPTQSCVSLPRPTTSSG